MSMSVTHTAVASGNGKLKAKDLNSFAKAIPGDAVVDISTHKATDQRDNDSWTITAEWDGVAQDNWKPTGGVYR